MGDSAINAALLALFAGIGASLRPYLLMGCYWICRRTPPRSFARRILLGGAGFYYGWLAIALVVWLVWRASNPPA